MGIRSNGKTKVYVWTVILAISSLLFFANQAKAALPDGLILSYGINQSLNGTSEYMDKTTDIASVAGLTQGSIATQLSGQGSFNDGNWHTAVITVDGSGTKIVADYPGTLTDGSSSIDPSMLQDEAFASTKTSRSVTIRKCHHQIIQLYKDL